MNDADAVAREIVVGADVHADTCDCQWSGERCEQARAYLIDAIAAALRDRERPAMAALERAVTFEFRTERQDKHSGCWYDACALCSEPWGDHANDCHVPRLLDRLSDSLTAPALREREQPRRDQKASWGCNRCGWSGAPYHVVHLCPSCHESVIERGAHAAGVPPTAQRDEPPC